jgi:[protein-PII] uridylyltransferase
MADQSLRTARDALLADHALQGEQFCRVLSDTTDAWLSSLAETASEGKAKHLALLAIGGYGRQELCPFSDLDLLLVHDTRSSVDELADRLWYPIWDQGLKVDHAVRRPKEVLTVASSDLRVALGLLDARLIWGDIGVSEPLVERVRELWRNQLARDFLPELEAQMEERHRIEGDVAFLLEPNLKEAHGGLRDVNVLRSLPSCAPRLAELVDLSVIDAAAATLVAVRVELHRSAGRELDRLLLQEHDHIAASLGFEDADALCRSVSEAGRSIAHLSDETWRRRSLWEPASSGSSQVALPDHLIESGLVVVDGELTFGVDATLAEDPSLFWRLAAAAAEGDLPISLGALQCLAEQLDALRSPWSEALRNSLVRLLMAGHAAIAPFESFDHAGLITQVLPEWEHVRHYHQRNAYHRFTVDRHLLEAAANAAGLAEQVERPDLLVVGALLHDIGKGLPGDHTELGVELVAGIGARMGFATEDVAVLVSLVRNHLLLADVATRRDLSDPRTIETVAEAVGSISTLRILAALTKADSLATGSSAWSPWKEQLVDELVAATERSLSGGASEPLRSTESPEAYRPILELASTSDELQVLIDPPRVVVAAPDRPGLLADVAGTLALHRLDVLSADVQGFEGLILDVFTVEPLAGRWPGSEALREDLRRVLSHQLDLVDQLERQASTYAVGQRPWSARPVSPTVKLDNEASVDCTVIEVRAPDRIGLLHQLTAALFHNDLDVVAARVATIGGDVVDAFYVRTPEGAKLTDADRQAALEQALLKVLVETPG